MNTSESKLYKEDSSSHYQESAFLVIKEVTAIFIIAFIMYFLILGALLGCLAWIELG
jgi:hypothetical protein